MELLERGPLLDELSGLLAAVAAPREQLFDALLDELDQGGRPQVVVVEDAHWVDEATLDLLVFLGRRMDRTRALLIVTYRDDELGVDHPLRSVIGRLPPEAVWRGEVGAPAGAGGGGVGPRGRRPAPPAR